MGDSILKRYGHMERIDEGRLTKRINRAEVDRAKSRSRIATIIGFLNQHE